MNHRNNRESIRNEFRTAGSELGRNSQSELDGLLNNPSEFFALIAATGILIPVATGLAFAKIEGAAAWCVEKGVLVSSEDNPLIALPYAEGAGIDLRRIIVAAVLLLVLGVAARQTTTRVSRQRQLDALREGDM